MPSINPAQQNIIDETDQCVQCGLCLPHCPTYSIAKNEAESPRGRISLVRALHEGNLEPNPTLSHHLDTCLACLSCETVCPANVKFEKILEAGRGFTREHRSFIQRCKQTLLLSMLTTAGTRSVVKNIFKIYHLLGIHKILKNASIRFPYALRIFKLIPEPQQLAFTESFTSNITEKSRVALVTSCASDLFSDTTQASAKYVLQALNYEIVEPTPLRCCGALHQHNGHLVTAQHLMQKFSGSLTNERFDTLISLATGCAAQLNRYPELLGHDATTELISKHTDINAFVLQQLEIHKLKFKPLPKKVFIHKPCTQNFKAHGLHTVEQLLSKIPEIQLCIFEDELACCGAGGMNSLTQAKLADDLIANKISELTSSNATHLVTSNIGCSLHFQAQLHHENSAIITCHPITLLAQQLLYSSHA